MSFCPVFIHPNTPVCYPRSVCGKQLHIFDMRTPQLTLQDKGKYTKEDLTLIWLRLVNWIQITTWLIENTTRLLDYL